MSPSESVRHRVRPKPLRAKDRGQAGTSDHTTKPCDLCELVDVQPLPLEECYFVGYGKQFKNATITWRCRVVGTYALPGCGVNDQSERIFCTEYEMARYRIEKGAEAPNKIEGSYKKNTHWRRER